jgi:high-affinity iron transporter
LEWLNIMKRQGVLLMSNIAIVWLVCVWVAFLVGALAIGARTVSAAPLRDDPAPNTTATSAPADKGAQLLQFLGLMQAEYEKAVQNGQVQHAEEYDEARTYHQRAVAAFNDLRPTFETRDAAKTAQLQQALTEMGRLIEQKAGADDVEKLVLSSSALLKDTFGATAMQGGVKAIEDLLDRARDAIAQGEYAEAEDIRLQAYALYETGMEPRLISRNGELRDEIEALFWQGTPRQAGLAALIGQHAPAAQITPVFEQVLDKLNDADALLNTQMSPLGVIASAVAILIREGLEAVLVIAAVLGYLRATQAPPLAQRQVLGGAGLGVALSLLTWVAAQGVLSITAVNRELFEGIIALLAAAVLFYVTNWLLHKVYITDWLTFVKEQVQRAMRSGSGGSLLGLVLLGFMVVFREGFETVLFFQALLFDAPAWAVLVGLVIGLALIVALGVLVLRFSARLPLRLFFTVTSALMLILAVAFVGNGLRNLQEAGLIGVTRFDIIPVGFVPSLIGLFPTLETVLGQVTVLALLALTFTLAKVRARGHTAVNG